MKTKNPILFYPFTENYSSKEEDKKPEIDDEKSEKDDGKIHYQLISVTNENGEEEIRRHVQLPEIVVEGEGLMKKLESYIEDPEIRNGVEKMLNALTQRALSKDFKKLETVDVSAELHNIIEKYPNLLFDISGKRGLPVSEKNFSNLTTQQKLNFYELYEATHSTIRLSQTTDSIRKKGETVHRNVELKLFEELAKQQIKNFDDIKDTLKDFGLTDWESKRVLEFFSFLGRHPEFGGTNDSLRDLREEILLNHYDEILEYTVAGGPLITPTPNPGKGAGQMAKNLAKRLLPHSIKGIAKTVLGIALLLGVAYGSYRVYERRNNRKFGLGDKDGKAKHGKDEWIKIEDPEGVLEIIGVEIPRKRSVRDTVEMYDVDKYKVKTDEEKSNIEKIKDWGEEKAKKLINKFEKRIITMEIEGKAQVVFDGEKMEVFYNEKTKELRIDFAKPIVEAKNTKRRIEEEKHELIHDEKFDSVAPNLYDRGVQEALDSIQYKDENFYKQCLDTASHQLSNHFKTLCDKIKKDQVKKVTIRIYLDDDKSNRISDEFTPLESSPTRINIPSDR